MKKFLKYAALSLAGLILIGWVGMWAWSRSLHAQAAAEAVAALTTDASVAVEQGENLVFRPVGKAATLGVILYPGASCDIRGYAPLLRRIAAAGYLVVDVAMPLEFALFAPNRALGVMAAHPEVKRWVLIGHSMGGAMAGTFVAHHPDSMAGLILWDAYPASGLADYHHPVWLIHRARPDGTPPASFVNKRSSFPADSHWVPIPGGIHMYFGAFDGGGYKEEWAAQIPHSSQHDQAVTATLAALKAMGG